jgi:transcriptional regulator with XRE-family HTH domain
VTVNNPILGELLKHARQAAGLTQEALATRAGLSARAISDLERNVNHTPRPGTLQLLFSALSLSADERQHFEAAARADDSNAGSAHWTVMPARNGEGRASIPELAPLPPLVGRASEQALLERHLAGEGPPLLVLSGEPGIGKTRLLQEAAALASARGLNVLQGTVAAPGPHSSGDPIVDALRRGIQRRPPVVLRRDLQGCAWLVRALPELAFGPIDPLPSVSLAPEQETVLTARAMMRFLSNVAGPAGTLLTLDELHHADAAAVELLSRLLYTATDGRLRIIAAYRDSQSTGGDSLSSLLARLAHDRLVRHLTLPPLSMPHAAELLLAVSSNRSEQLPAWLDRVLHETGGVPFYLVAWAQDLQVVEGEPAVDDVPWPIRQSVRYRMDAAPPAVRAVLEALATAGGRATYALLAALVARSDAETLIAVEWSCRERLIEEDSQSYQFTYGAVRTVVEAELSYPRRVLMRGRLAALVARGLDGVQAGRRRSAATALSLGNPVASKDIPGRSSRTNWRTLSTADERAYHLAVLTGHRARPTPPSQPCSET